MLLSLQQAIVGSLWMPACCIWKYVKHKKLSAHNLVFIRWGNVSYVGPEVKAEKKSEQQHGEFKSSVDFLQGF